MAKAIIMKRDNWGLAYSFRELVHYHGGDHGSMQADAGTVVESYNLIQR